MVAHEGVFGVTYIARFGREFGHYFVFSCIETQIENL
jgi:hypothetical protein